ncbi:hypothetical protein SISNIDRAFT_465242 [Sistotremastrum niveocremeum HHB9708]|uniref:Uncharacterized protein n=1 Tax=Sistotremastrum niveocremeum HHB9708 TaxID=1314777 RepID=A0A164WFU1_9AGAM|nr:hypothetical protein SISNIDRAFT_465242 [Sistotremastrum niveocremeum HHB9708]
MAQINNAGDKHRSPDASNNNLQERNEDPATRRKQKKTDAWNQHEKSVRQSEKRRATAHRKGCTGCHLIVISPVKSKRRRRRRTSSPSSLSNILSTTHDKSPAPLSPKTRADLTDEDESGNSQAEHKTPRNSEEEEEADPEADEVEEGDAHGNTRARKTIRKATMKTKAFDYHQVIAEARKDSLQEVFELQQQNILTLQETDQRSKQYIAQVQQKSYKAARKAAGFHDEEPLNPKTSVSANARYWSYIESIGGKAKARLEGQYLDVPSPRWDGTCNFKANLCAAFCITQDQILKHFRRLFKSHGGVTVLLNRWSVQGHMGTVLIGEARRSQI